MPPDPPDPTRTLRRARPRPADERPRLHYVHPRPEPGVHLWIDGAWRRGVVTGWLRYPDGPVQIATMWSDGQYTYIDHWTHDPDLVKPADRDIWGPNPPR